MKILVAILTLVAMATSGCGGGGGDSSTTTGVKTQEVLNWQVVGEGPDPDYKIVRFFTKTTISPLLAAIPEAVLAGQRDVVSLYYGDLSAGTGAGAGYDELLVAGLLRTAKLIDREAVALFLRGDGDDENEIPTQRALFEFLATEFNIELFNLYGEGNGAVVVASIYQHPPLQHLVATVGLSSPSFDNPRRGGYSPYDHIGKLVGLEPPIPILLVFSDRANPSAARVYLERAERLGVEMVTGVAAPEELSRHGMIEELAALLREEEHLPEVASRPVTINVELPYPEDDYNNVRVGISAVTVTCLGGCEGTTTKVTDRQGEVTFTGRPPLIIRAEKSGHITVEQQTYGGRVNMGHEWPVELRESIRQLNLEDAIATGELLLIWGDEEYIDDDGWGQFSCPVIIIKQIPDRNFMLAILAHENLHAWQGRRSNNPPCDLHYGYPPTEEARSWMRAWEKDLEAHGPYPGVDDSAWASTLLENQAGIYGHWYWGPETEWLVEPPAWADKKAALEQLYRLAPNRTRYLEDRFGGPPPR